MCNQLVYLSLYIDDGKKVIPIPEPAGCVDRDGSNRVTSTRPQVSPVGRVDRAEHIQVPPDHGGGGGGGGGNRAGHTHVPVGRADGNEASLIRQRISKVGGADKNSELSGEQLASYNYFKMMMFV